MTKLFEKVLKNGEQNYFILKFIDHNAFGSRKIDRRRKGSKPSNVCARRKTKEAINKIRDINMG